MSTASSRLNAKKVRVVVAAVNRIIRKCLIVHVQNLQRKKYHYVSSIPFLHHRSRQQYTAHRLLLVVIYKYLFIGFLLVNNAVLDLSVHPV